VRARRRRHDGRALRITHCRQHLAAYKVPRAIQFATQVPMTSSGKIMRRVLTDIDDGTGTTASDLSHAVT